MTLITPLILFTMLAPSVHAFGPSVACHKPKTQSLVELTAAFSDINRQSPEEYAKSKNKKASDIHKEFSANGKIICDNGKTVRESTASVVGRKNLIVTNGHAFYKNLSCDTSQMDTCYFETVFPPIERRNLNVQSAKMGFCEPGVTNLNTDWAVVELDKPIDHVTPYDIPLNAVAAREGDQLLQVSSHSKDANAPQFSSCGVLGTNVEAPSGSRTYPVANSCPSIGGMSGSPQLMKKNNNWVIQAIQAVSPSDAKDGRNSSLEFYQYNASVPVSGGLWVELNRRITGEHASK